MAPFVSSLTTSYSISFIVYYSSTVGTDMYAGMTYTKALTWEIEST